MTDSSIGNIVLKKEIQKNFHFLHISLGYGVFYFRPRFQFRKWDSLDFHWLGLQITWRYYGNAREMVTGMKLKDYDKLD